MGKIAKGIMTVGMIGGVFLIGGFIYKMRESDIIKTSTLARVNRLEKLATNEERFLEDPSKKEFYKTLHKEIYQENNNSEIQAARKDAERITKEGTSLL